MGYLIGDNGIGITTWGSLRRAVVQNGTPLTYSHNVEYPAGSAFFKSEEGKGLIVGGLQPSFFVAYPSATVNTYGASVFAFTFLDIRYEAVLTGENVTTDWAETFAIDSSAFSSPYQTVVPPIIGLNIDDIGLFDPVT